MALDIESILRPTENAADPTLDPAWSSLEDTPLVSEDAPPAEQPNWHEALRECQRLLQAGKHLEVVNLLAVASLKVNGLEGLRDALELIDQLLQHHWDELLPPVENGDASSRLNVLRNLSVPPGSFSDPLRLRQRLRSLAILGDPPRYSLRDLARARAKRGTETDGASGEADLVESAIAQMPAARVQSLHQVLDQCLRSLQQIDQAIVQHDSEPIMAPLIQVVEELRQALPPQDVTTSQPAAAPALPEAPASTAPGQAPVGRLTHGSITSSQQAMAALDALCGYFQRHEPSSPIPLLLMRARGLVDKSFVDIIRDLSPDSIGHIEMIAGRVLESAPKET